MGDKTLNQIVVSHSISTILYRLPCHKARRGSIEQPAPSLIQIQKSASVETLALLIFVGGGGGELNSPSKRRLPEYPTGLVSSFYLV